jgi:hypothetical protein
MGRQNLGEGSKEDDRIPAREFVAAHMGVTRAWVDKFLGRRYITIQFDRADALMCAMNVAHEWLTEETFWAIYQGIDFKGLDAAKPCTALRAA